MRAPPRSKPVEDAVAESGEAFINRKLGAKKMDSKHNRFETAYGGAK